MVSRRVINRDFKRRVLIAEESAQKEKRFLTEKQVAWLIYENFKVSDTHESVSDLNEILNVELKNHNVQSLNTQWDETTIAMTTQPESESRDCARLGKIRRSKEPTVITTANGTAESTEEATVYSPRHPECPRAKK